MSDPSAAFDCPSSITLGSSDSNTPKDARTDACEGSPANETPEPERTVLVVAMIVGCMSFNVVYILLGILGKEKDDVVLNKAFYLKKLASERSDRGEAHGQAQMDLVKEKDPTGGRRPRGKRASGDTAP
ncbi:unnamed protein product [Prorocentrum cordatum]|uniref:Uncharacterized protein n=1 Tax=Prorocentrum cordatum TaxID=2364126 RepID=A0ABN9XYQ8_9DINO|nr:unnamed protein product [Polarella glacialis]